MTLKSVAVSRMCLANTLNVLECVRRSLNPNSVTLRSVGFIALALALALALTLTWQPFLRGKAWNCLRSIRLWRPVYSLESCEDSYEAPDLFNGRV